MHLPWDSHPSARPALIEYFLAVEVISVVSATIHPADGVAACLRGVQHVGITVRDLHKSMEFYTEVLGGELVASGDGIYGEFLHNSLFQDEELNKMHRGANVGKRRLPDLRDGSKQVLDLRLITLGDAGVELLHFRDANSRPAAPSILESVPSAVGFVNAMHLCLQVRDQVDLNEFAAALEEECRKRQIAVVCNRLVPVSSEKERREVAQKYFVNRFWKDPKYFIEGYSDRDFGDFQGCAFFYCKGPDGEQLEFCQVTRKLKQRLVKAKRQYKQSAAGQLCSRP